MSWVKTDDQLLQNGKYLSVSPMARLLWHELRVLAARTGGRIPRLAAENHAFGLCGSRRESKGFITELLEAGKPMHAYGLLEDHDGILAVHDWEDYNPSAEKVSQSADALSSARSERARKGAEARWGKGKQGPQEADASDASSIHQAYARDASSIAYGMLGDAPVPDPVPNSDAKWGAKEPASIPPAGASNAPSIRGAHAPSTCSDDAWEGPSSAPVSRVMAKITADWTPSEALLAAVEMIGVPRDFALQVSLPTFRAHHLGESFVDTRLAQSWRRWCTSDKTSKYERWKAERDKPARPATQRGTTSLRPSNQTLTGQSQTPGSRRNANRATIESKVATRLRVDVPATADLEVDALMAIVRPISARLEGEGWEGFGELPPCPEIDRLKEDPHAIAS